MVIFGRSCERKILAGHLRGFLKEQYMLVAFIRNVMGKLRNKTVEMKK